MELFFVIWLTVLMSLVSGKEDILSSMFSIEDLSITVNLKPYEEKVLECKIQVESNVTGYFNYYLLYDKNGPNYYSPVFEYIGDTDNSCSFIIYPSIHLKNYFDFQNVFKGKWTIIEKYACDKSFWNIFTLVYNTSKGGCYRKHIIFFNPRTITEVMSMTWASTKIIRKAPYDNKTLTVFVQSEEQPITTCKLSLGTNFYGFNGNDIIYDKDSSYSSSAQSGLEYIGLYDNSCSVRIHLDVLNTTNNEDKLLNQDWIITVDGSNENSIYSFYMNSKNWWIDNHYSRVFLRKKFPLSTDVQYF